MMSIQQSIAIGLITLLAPGGVPAATSARQSDAACSEAIDRLERETQQLHKDLDADVRDHIKDDVVDTSLKGIREHYKSKPTSEAVFDLKDKWEKFTTYAEYLQNARASIDDLIECVHTPGCSLLAFAQRQNEAIAKWIEHLGEEGLTAAAERATKAGNVLRNYAERTLNTATNGTMDTIGKCNANFERQANANSTVDETGKPAGSTPPANSRGGGGGSGKTIIGVLGATAAVAGGIVAAQGLKQSLDDFSTTGSTSTSTSTPSTTPTSGGAFNGTYRAVVTRSCQLGAGNVNVLSPSFQEPCVNAITSGGCSPTDFTVRVTNGTVSDCGPWLNNGSVTSTGSYSGVYQGVCGAAPSGVGISGNFTSGSLSGFGTCRGNTYTISVSLSRQ